MSDRVINGLKFPAVSSLGSAGIKGRIRVLLTDGALYYDNGENWLNLDKFYRFSKPVTIENPTGTEAIELFYTDVAITVIKIADLVRGISSPSVSWNVKFDSDRDAVSPTSLFGSNRTTTTTGGTTTTTFGNAEIPAGSFVWFETSSVSGTVTKFHTTIIFSQ